MILGKTGCGKSATGNSILNAKKFQTKLSGSSVTHYCSHNSAIRFNRKIVIVDTPGIFDTKVSNDKVQEEIYKCIGITSPGPHAFVLVLNIVDRFTEEEERTVKHFEKYFGEKIYKYLIVLFTRKDELKANDTTLSAYIDNCPSNLKKFIKKCGNRVSAFDNNLKGSEQEEQVRELLELILKNIRGNGGNIYTNDMYVTVEQKMKTVEHERLKKEKEKILKEILHEREKNPMCIKAEQNLKGIVLDEDAFRNGPDDFTTIEQKREQGVQKLKTHFEGLSISKNQRLKGDDEEQLDHKSKSVRAERMHGVIGLKSHFEKLNLNEEHKGGNGIKEQKIKEEGKQIEIEDRNEKLQNENTFHDHLMKRRGPGLDNIHDSSKNIRESLLLCHLPGKHGEEIKHELEKKLMLKEKTIRDELRKEIEEKPESKSILKCTIL